MANKPNSMRVLDADGIIYDVLRFPDTLHSAQEVAEHFGLPAAQVYKTLVLLTSRKTPLLIMAPADQELRIKPLAQHFGDKKLRMATHNEAEKVTGLKVGGISALALRHRNFPVYLMQTAAVWDTIVVSAGQRGVNLRLAVADIVRVTSATFVDAPMDAAPPRPQAPSGRRRQDTGVS
jgi:Cys-tRNA(Pro)/Cys-tRNA(Cys) deacylase